jgi:hypothetical protein
MTLFCLSYSLEVITDDTIHLCPEFPGDDPFLSDYLSPYEPEINLHSYQLVGQLAARSGFTCKQLWNLPLTPVGPVTSAISQLIPFLINTLDQPLNGPSHSCFTAIRANLFRSLIVLCCSTLLTNCLTAQRIKSYVFGMV